MQIHYAQCVACCCWRLLITFFFLIVSTWSETILWLLWWLIHGFKRESEACAIYIYFLRCKKNRSFVILNLQNYTAFIWLKVFSCSVTNYVFTFVIFAALMITYVCLLTNMCQTCSSFVFDGKNISSIMTKCSEAKFINKTSFNWPYGDNTPYCNGLFCCDYLRNYI